MERDPGTRKEASTEADRLVDEGVDRLSMSRGADRTSEVVQAEEDALACFERALALVPNHPSAMANKGLVLLSLDRYNDANAALTEAVGLQQEDGSLWHAAARALVKLDRPSEATQAYENALRLRPDDVDVRFELAQLFSELGLHDKAIASFDFLVAVPPDPISVFPQVVRFHRARALAHSGRESEATAAFSDAIERVADKLSLHSYSQELMLSLRSSAAARAAYGMHLDKRSNASSWLWAGRLHGEAGHPADALAAYEAATRLAPKSTDAWMMLADALTIANRFDDAQFAYQAAIDADEENTIAHYRMARSLMKAGRQADAAAAFGVVLDMDPQFPGAKDGLSEATNGPNPTTST